MSSAEIEHPHRTKKVRRFLSTVVDQPHSPLTAERLQKCPTKENQQPPRNPVKRTYLDLAPSRKRAQFAGPKSGGRIRTISASSDSTDGFDPVDGGEAILSLRMKNASSNTEALFGL
ncbi:unnamed protein product [Mortierella alpina]